MMRIRCLDTVIMGNARLYDIMKEKEADLCKRRLSPKKMVSVPVNWKQNLQRWTVGNAESDAERC